MKLSQKFEILLSLTENSETVILNCFFPRNSHFSFFNQCRKLMLFHISVIIICFFVSFVNNKSFLDRKLSQFFFVQTNYAHKSSESEEFLPSYGFLLRSRLCFLLGSEWPFIIFLSIVENSFSRSRSGLSLRHLIEFGGDVLEPMNQMYSILERLWMMKTSVERFVFKDVMGSAIWRRRRRQDQVWI